MRIRNNIVKMYSMMTGQTTDQVILDLDRLTIHTYITYTHAYVHQTYVHTYIHTLYNILCS